MGNESALLECSTTDSGECLSQEIATVICQGMVLGTSSLHILHIC